MNEHEANTHNLFLHLDDHSGFASRACATALTLALCCTPLTSAIAFADDGSSSSESSSSAAAASEDTAESEPSESEGADGEGDSSTEGDTDTETDTDSGSEQGSDSETETEAESGDGDEQDGSSETSQESDDTSDSDENSSSSESKEKDSSSDSVKKKIDKRDEKTSKVEGKKMTKEEEAADKRSQAEAIVSHMNKLKTELDKRQAQYDKAKKAYDEAVLKRKNKQAAFEKASKKLEALREELSDFVVEMYKQGGVAPYLDVLLSATTYEEFISAWYLLDEVSFYGKDEIHKRVKKVEKLEAEAKEARREINKAKKVMKEYRLMLNRSKMTYLSLAPHAASLRMEAAELDGDSAAYQAAKADYDRAKAALDEALEEGLAFDGRLEGEGIFTHPCPDATYSSGFGYRTFDHSYHLGLDMAIGEGTPYYAADSGTVTASTNGGGYNGGAGNWIVIDHGNGIVTKYMHSSVTFVEPGDKVVRGQNIGLVGNTGDSYGAHLHFQVEINGVAVDPMIYL